MNFNGRGGSAGIVGSVYLGKRALEESGTGELPVRADDTVHPAQVDVEIMTAVPGVH